MSFLRCSSIALLLTTLAAPAAAESRVGQQWLTTGVSVSPAVVTDKNGIAYGAGSNAVVGGGLRLRVGFQHVVAKPFVMAAEIELGNQYFPDSTLSPDGYSNGGGGFAWQAGLVGRWTPRGEAAGPALGFGLHTFRASLPDTPVQTLAGDVRFGWYFWRDKQFALAEFGYALPFLQGLDSPESFGLEEVSSVEKEWTMHQFVFGFSYGF